MDSQNSPARRVWLRRLVIAVSCIPFAAAGFLAAVGRSGDHGVLGEWYVLVPLAIVGFFSWDLIEKAIGTTRDE
ncbi:MULTISPECIES: hypothetical protein [Actinoplanes]|uniref:hypothetical protein n=1 Tax=Actinoplanes TaxID=1865 RepID=UPI0005F2D0A7|nr:MULTISPECIES: hypothetical protein [Actinoplanes]GLY04472.1 hypothetical protein Acsp01_48510 [Actinoplanes sp. NBRC 101535]